MYYQKTMDTLRILVAGDVGSGKTTCINAIKISRLGSYSFELTEYNDSIKIANIAKDYDIIFYIFNLKGSINMNFIIELGSMMQNEYCLFVPIANKVDLVDYTADEKTGKIILDEHGEEILGSILKLMKENFDEEHFYNDRLICSFEYSYMYLFLSTCVKNSKIADKNIMSHIGQYEMGKQVWSKYTIAQKDLHIINVIERIKKSSKLNEMLMTFGYTFKLTSQFKAIVPDDIMLKIAVKHLHSLQLDLEQKIKIDSFVDVLEFVSSGLLCIYPYIVNSLNLKEVIELVREYIKTYDYTKLDFVTKCNILTYLKENNIEDATNLFSMKNISDEVSKTINFLTAMLSHETEEQLKCCTTFDELIVKLSTCLDITTNICVEKIISNHQVFKSLLFDCNIKTYIDLIFENFEIDIPYFMYTIMEQKLDILLNTEIVAGSGIVESMLIVQDYLDSNSDESVRKYRVMLKYALYGKHIYCDKNVLMQRLENEETLYIEKMYIAEKIDSELEESENILEDDDTPEDIYVESSPPIKSIKNRVK
jgi:hypothetical protein